MFKTSGAAFRWSVFCALLSLLFAALFVRSLTVSQDTSSIILMCVFSAFACWMFAACAKHVYDEAKELRKKENGKDGPR